MHTSTSTPIQSRTKFQTEWAQTAQGLRRRWCARLYMASKEVRQTISSCLCSLRNICLQRNLLPLTLPHSAYLPEARRGVASLAMVHHCDVINEHSNSFAAAVASAKQSVVLSWSEFFEFQPKGIQHYKLRICCAHECALSNRRCRSPGPGLHFCSASSWPWQTAIALLKNKTMCAGAEGNIQKAQRTAHALVQCRQDNNPFEPS